MTDMHNDKNRNRFELTIDNHIVYADYKRDGDTLYIMYVEKAQKILLNC